MASVATRIGSVADVLVEDTRSGRSEHYAPVNLTFDATPGSIVKAHIADVRDSHLVGQKAA